MSRAADSAVPGRPDGLALCRSDSATPSRPDGPAAHPAERVR